jgi:hypothetical protein
MHGLDGDCGLHEGVCTVDDAFDAVKDDTLEALKDELEADMRLRMNLQNMNVGHFR